VSRPILQKTVSEVLKYQMRQRRESEKEIVLDGAEGNTIK